MAYFDATITVAIRGEDRKEAYRRLKSFIEINGWPCNIGSMRHEPSGESIDFIDDVALMAGINLGDLAESQGIKPLLSLGDAVKRAGQIVSVTCDQCRKTYYTNDDKMAVVMCLRYHRCPDCLKR